jgi:uncharacterized phage protein (TIGR01671 family)
MRELKFRVWDKVSGCMRDSVLAVYFFEGTEQSSADVDSEHGVLHFEDRYVLLQYIGLKDVNGKEIYEGDITSDGEEIIFGKIGYDGSWNGLTGFYFRERGRGSEEDEFIELDYYNDPTKIEIVGNIYENPELLEKK